MEHDESTATTDKEAPEADALEQAVPADPDAGVGMFPLSKDQEAAEADRIEQATPVPLDEEWEQD